MFNKLNDEDLHQEITWEASPVDKALSVFANMIEERLEDEEMNRWD